jgi:hypothetical protein
LKEILNFRIIYFKKDVSVDTNALHRSVTKVANLEEIVADNSPTRDFLPGQSFKPTMAAICWLPLKCCVT